MERGWSAKGLLEPLYKQHGGRDKLAKKAAASPATLSAVNNGRQNLGEALARRLAAAAGVSLAELGAPAEVVDPRSQGVLDRLAELEAAIDHIEDQRRLGIEGVVRQLVEIRAVLVRVAPGSVPPSWAADQ